MTRTKSRGLMSAVAVALSVCTAWVVVARAATDVIVRATFKGAPVPGATVVASHDEARVAGTTDEDGECHLTLDAGAWTIRVEMRGFDPVTRDLVVDTAAASVDVALSMVSPTASFAASHPGPLAPSHPGTLAPLAPSAPSAPSAPVGAAPPGSLIVNGSTYNAAASPFAQTPAFGNNRIKRRSLFNGSVALVGGDSAWDARPYSFSPEPAPVPSYADVQLAGTFGGPLTVPHVRWLRPLVTASYAHAAATTANTISTRVPTVAERSGDFSQGADAQRPVIDPSTGAPFPGNVIPSDRISPQARALLAFYPAPNASDVNGANDVATMADRTTRDTLQVRFSQSMTNRQDLSGAVSYQRADTTSTSLFQFADASRTSNVDASATWTYRASPTKSVHAHYEIIGASSAADPFFANRIDVSGDAGIGGNDQSPGSWGPPTLAFTSGLASLTSAAPTFQRQHTHAAGGDMLWLRGNHSVSFGAEWRTRRVDSTAQVNPRGTFTFTGAATGDDVADFLLGLPHASAISFGGGRAFLGTLANAFVVDDWHVAAPVTINVGVRWEYESPLRERGGEMANLDLAPDFSAAQVVTPGSPVGATTGRRFDSALIDPDRGGIQPRIGVSWRPFAASSFLVRGGYGIYRQTDVYLPIAMWLAEQPPFSTVASLESTPQRPLTLADGFSVAPDALPNTFAVDPHLRAPYAENWQLSAQRDLPGSLTIAGTYLGTRGHHLLQESLPNTVPPGAVNPCPTCPVGFIYVSSNGESLRNALQIQLRRRSRNGLSASVQYTVAKATDDAPALAGVGAAGASIAQDWRDLDAEWGPSTFDQRHLAAASVEYTTGVGASGGGLLTGRRGALVKGWVFAGQITAGSGLPLTPIYLTSVPGTGVTGTIRASVVDNGGAAPSSAYFLDPARYAAPAAGQWGTAGRDSARGPAQFSFNASVGRTFTMRGQTSLEWRLDATNALNRVTYVSVNTLVGSPQFGLPDRADTMRRIRMTLRWRF